MSTQKWLVILAFLSVLLTIGSGLQAYYSVNHDGPSHLAMTDHRNWAFATGGVYILAMLIYFFNAKLRQSLAGILFVTAFVLVSVTAFKGGELVYRHGLGVMSLPEVTGDGHDHDHGDGGHDHGTSAEKGQNNQASGHDHTTEDAHDHSETQTDDGHQHDHPDEEHDHSKNGLQSETESEDAGHDHSSHQHEHADGEHDHSTTDESGQDKNEDESHDHSTHQHEYSSKSSGFIGMDSDAAKSLVAFHQALNSSNGNEARKYLDDSILIYEGGGVERSADQYASHHMLSDMKFLSSVSITTVEQQVKVMGDVAYSTSVSKIRGTYKGKDLDLTSMETAILKKGDEGWKIIHLHWSN
jgi:ketosteroid isomerase-like protein